MSSTRYLSMDEVCALVHLSRARINQLRFGVGKRGTPSYNKPDPSFPVPRKLGAGKGGRILWREDEIVAWVEAQAQEPAAV